MSTTHPSRARRLAASMTGAVLVTGALLSGAGSATAAPAAAAGPAAAPGGGIVGTWSAVTTIRTKDGTLTGRPTLVFAPGGRLCLTTELSTGRGTWNQAGAAFVFRALETQNDPALGTVRINQAGRQRGDAFTSGGVSLVFDASGRQTGTTLTTVRATRTSTSTAGC